jgi:hypothetical protein
VRALATNASECLRADVATTDAAMYSNMLLCIICHPMHAVTAVHGVSRSELLSSTQPVGITLQTLLKCTCKAAIVLPCVQVGCECLPPAPA